MQRLLAWRTERLHAYPRMLIVGNGQKRDQANPTSRIQNEGQWELNVRLCLLSIVLDAGTSGIDILRTILTGE